MSQAEELRPDWRDLWASGDLGRFCFISLGIVHDGFRSTKAALGDLMDQRALAYDSAEPHPAIDQVRGILRALPWVDDAGVRIRDMGQVLHVEAFVVPQARDAGVAQIREASEAIADASWQMHRTSS